MTNDWIACMRDIYIYIYIYIKYVIVMSHIHGVYELCLDGKRGVKKYLKIQTNVSSKET